MHQKADTRGSFFVFCIFWYCNLLRDVILYSDLSKLAFLWQIVSLNYSNPLWRILVFCFKTPQWIHQSGPPPSPEALRGINQPAWGSYYSGYPIQFVVSDKFCSLVIDVFWHATGLADFRGKESLLLCTWGIAFVIMSLTQLTCVVFPT